MSPKDAPVSTFPVLDLQDHTIMLTPFKSIFVFMCLSVLSTGMCMCTMCVLGAQRAQKRVFEPQVWVFKLVVSCHVGNGNRTPASARAANVLNHGANLPCPYLTFCLCSGD